MKKVICTKIGSCDHCKGCGAAKLHYSDSCEPCPVVLNATCIEQPKFLKSAVLAAGFGSKQYYSNDRKQWLLIPRKVYIELKGTLSENYEIIEENEEFFQIVLQLKE